MEKKQSKNGLSRSNLNGNYTETRKAAIVTAQNKQEDNHLEVINNYKARS